MVGICVWVVFVHPLLLTSSQAYVATVLKLRSGQIWQLASVCHPVVTHKRPDAMCPPGSRSLDGLRALAGAATQRVCSQLYFLGHVIDWGHMEHIRAYVSGWAQEKPPGPTSSAVHFGHVGCSPDTEKTSLPASGKAIPAGRSTPQRLLRWDWSMKSCGEHTAFCRLLWE